MLKEVDAPEWLIPNKNTGSTTCFTEFIEFEVISSNHLASHNARRQKSTWCHGLQHETSGGGIGLFQSLHDEDVQQPASNNQPGFVHFSTQNL